MEEQLFEFDDGTDEDKEEVLGGFNASGMFDDFEEETTKKEESEDKEEDEKKEDTETIKDPPVNEDITKLEQSNADSLSMIGDLNKQVDHLQKQFEDKNTVVEDDIKLPTDEDWELDPKSATEKLIEISEIKSKAEAARTSDEKFIETKQQEVFTHTQSQAWREAAELAPDIGVEGTEIRQLVGSIYKQAGLQNHPMGPLFATCAALVHTARINNDSNNTVAREEGAQIERSRQDRINKGTMSADGGDDSSDDVVLNSQHLAIAKRMGVSPEAYKKSLMAMR